MVKIVNQAAVMEAGDDPAVYLINQMPVKWQGYATQYWAYLCRKGPLPDFNDFPKLSYGEAQQARLKLAQLNPTV